MEFRPGTCSACKASFRIPATFTANKAKCSKCGGVVEIGPITNDAASLTPASTDPAKATSAPIASAAARLASKPASPTGLPTGGRTIPPAPLPLTHPSTEGVQLSVNPVPTQPTPPTPGKPVVPAKPVPASKPPVQAPKATTPLPKPASAAKPVVPAKPAAKSGMPGTAAKPVVAHGKAALPGTKHGAKASPVAAGKGKHAAEHDEADEEDRAERRRRLEKRKGPSPLVFVGAVVLLLGVSVPLYFVYKKSRAEAIAADSAAAAAKQAKIDKAIQEQRDIELKNIEEEERLAAAKAAKAAAAPTDAEKAASDAAAAEAAAKAAADKPAGVKKPVEGYDLSLIPDFPPYEGTTPEEWTELQTLAATFVDASAGARASRAGFKLEETPKKSFPAILNQFKKLDLENEDGFRNADATQKMLERICHGHNMGWKYPHQEDWLQYDQKAIKKWCDTWAKASIDEVAWNKLIKADKAAEGDPEEGAPAKPKKIDDF